MIEGMRMGRIFVLVVVGACIASESAMVTVSARYLPTRSQDDRLERLRELLKDLLESQSFTENRQNETPATDRELGGSSIPRLSSGRSIYKREVDESAKLLKQPGIDNLGKSRRVLI